MPIAAVPRYLGSDFRSASPALRFGMYLKLWGVDSRSEKKLWTTHDVNYRRAGRDQVERRFKDQNKTSALGAAVTLNESDRKSMTELARRQQAAFRALAGLDSLVLTATSIAPFTTGLGNEHPLENGFSFLNPYGLPYLPGSGVKGVLRRAAEELAHRDFFLGDSGWTLPAIWSLFGFEAWPEPNDKGEREQWKQWIGGFSMSAEDIESYLDGVLDPASESSRKLKAGILIADDPLRALMQQRNLHVRGALEFWDVIPQIADDKLAVEIMTPHHSHYYQGKPEAGSKSPHDSGQPNPISFLTIPQDTGFTFHVRCDRHRLSRYTPDLTRNDHWRALLKSAFEHAFEWLGFGAKTAVGYGAMKLDLRAEEEACKRRKEEAARRAEQERERRRLEAEQAELDRREAEKAAFDALPASRRRVIEVERALGAYQERSGPDEHHRNEVKAEANRLAEEAPLWLDATEREAAAVLLEKLYDEIGWHDPGRNRKQRTRQEKKRRDAVASIRRGA